MFDPEILIKTVGLVGIFLIIFAESGLFFGFFLPGDSLLFIAGIFASQGIFNIYVLIIGCILFAILGDSVGYFTGKKFGRRFFQTDGRFFKKKYMSQTEQFYEKHGKYTLIIARFVPIVRTFAPIAAGLGNMNYKSFIIYNVIGGILWVVSLLSLGYLLGGLITNPDKYILPIILIIIAISLLPVFSKGLQLMRNKSN